MKRLVLLLALAWAVIWPAAAGAHPLGNFTINRFSRIEVAGDRVYVRYVLDMAEIPTFQAGRVDRDEYARTIASRAVLDVDGRRAALRPTDSALAHPKGAGGLPTTRLEVILVGPRLRAPSEVAYHDGNFAGRPGWKEIVVGANAPSKSHELRAYPKDLLSSPLALNSVRTRLRPTEITASPPRLAGGRVSQAPDRTADSGFASLIGRDRLGLGAVLVSLALAFFWGTAHALSPGHGKTIVTAYLVGQRGTPAHAALLGLIVTATHTAGVVALGLVTLALSEFLLPEQLYPWLNLASGVLVLAIGAGVLAARLRHRHRHAHRHAHDHGHDHGHGGPSRRSLLAVGISGGLLPCPSALVVLLAAISLHRVAFGMLLIVAFSAGLALSITGIGLLALWAKRALGHVTVRTNVALRLLPAVSALVIVGAGLAMTLRAVTEVL